jgi:hypothetical protein
LPQKTACQLTDESLQQARYSALLENQLLLKVTPQIAWSYCTE